MNRKCTRRDLWDGDICDYAAISWVLGRSLSRRIKTIAHNFPFLNVNDVNIYLLYISTIYKRNTDVTINSHQLSPIFFHVFNDGLFQYKIISVCDI